MGQQNLLYMLLCIASITSITLMCYSVMEVIHEHEKDLPKTDESAGIEKFNSTTIQKKIHATVIDGNDVNNNATFDLPGKMVDTTRAADDEDALYLLGICVFLTIPLSVIYVCKVKILKYYETEMTELMNVFYPNYYKPTGGLCTEAIVEIYVNVDNAMEIKDVVKKFLNVQDNLANVIESDVSGIF